MAPYGVDNILQIIHSEDMLSSTFHIDSLPMETPLAKLLLQCKAGHEVIFRECDDGAIICECYDCYFYHMLNAEEEQIIRDCAKE
jgi:hypothetical protein